MRRTIERTTSVLTGALLVAGGAALLALGPAVTGGSAEATGDETVRVFQLSDLADGETRTFGEGAHQISATRTGDQVALTIPEPEGAGSRTVTCHVKDDRCSVTTVDEGDARKQMVMIQKTGPDGGEEKDVNVFVTSGDGDFPLWVEKSDAEGVTIAGDGGDVRMMRVPGEPGQVLRCPEGDTTMHLGKDETAQAYLCPKHGVELKAVEGGHKVMRKVIVRTEGKDEARDAK